ncbi:MAG: hypothetical protein IH600_07220, partial [Bacteroidetes bacterium]|nr:hypothetical protein [Bacteroidota bacterium]
MRQRFTSLALFSTVLMMTCLSSMDAQVTFTVGTGTSSQSYPVNMVWWYSRSEAVYTSAEMISGGWTGGPGTISNVRWNIASVASYTPQTGSVLRIYLENTTQTTMTTGSPSTSGTLVWSGAHPLFNVAGWWNFTLTTPFVYSGGNLIVRVERDDSNYGSGAYFYYTSTTSTTHRGAYQDYTAPTSLTADYNRPNIQIVATASGDPPPFIVINTVPGCVASTSPGTTITATITDNNSVAQAAIWFRKNTGSWYNAAPTSIVGSAYTFAISHSTLGGLVNSDVVSWYIGARDNANNVATSPFGGSGTTPPGSTPPTTFNSYTAETILPLPYTQGFDTPGHGWTLGGTSSTWRIGA